jgi:ABC-type multidrug transport system permease subunit
MSGRLSRAAWIGFAIAAAVVVAVIVTAAGLWTGIGDSEISPAGWVAMILGAVATLALGVGLMGLVFYSSRRGYDEGGPDR